MTVERKPSVLPFYEEEISEQNLAKRQGGWGSGTNICKAIIIINAAGIEGITLLYIIWFIIIQTRSLGSLTCSGNYRCFLYIVHT